MNKNTLSSKTLIWIWWRNQKLSKQAKVKRSQHHYTSFTTNAKWSSLDRKHKRRKISTKSKPKTINKLVIGSHILIITLNVNGLNAPNKRHSSLDWIQKQEPYKCCLQETHLRPREIYRLKVRERKKAFHANGNQKKAGAAVFVSGKIDFKQSLL